MPSLGLSTTKAGGIVSSYVRDGLKLYMPHSSPKEVKFVGKGSTEFDGANDYITVADTSSLDITDAITVCAWVKPGVTASWKGLVGKSGEVTGASSASDVWDLYVAASNAVRFQVTNTDTATSTTTMSIGKWYFITGTYDGANVKIYVNGVLESTNARTAAIPTNNYPLLIGMYYNTANKFTGSMKNVAIWNRALSATEIQNIMYKSYSDLSSTLTSGLVSWWSLEKDDVFTDLKGSNNGTGTSLDASDITDSLYGGATPLIPRGVDNAPTVQADAIGTGYAVLNGSSDYISFGANFTGTTLSGNYSITAWIKPGAYSYETLFGSGGAGQDKNDYIQFINTTTMRVLQDSTAGSATLTHGHTFTTDEWQHFAFTRDADNSNTIKVYRNGIAPSGTITGAGTFKPDLFGAANATVEDFFNTSVCQVGMWNEVLTQPQIQSIMEKTYSELTSSEKTNLVSWWGLDSTIGDNTQSGHKIVEDEHNVSLGSELMDFDGQTGIIKSDEVSATSPWAAVGSTDYDFATISGTTITINNTGTWDSIRYAPGASANKIFKLTCTISVTSGSIQIYRDTTIDASHSIISSSGDYTFYYNTEEANFLLQLSSGDFIGSISNISVKEVLNSNAGVLK